MTDCSVTFSVTSYVYNKVLFSDSLCTWALLVEKEDYFQNGKLNSKYWLKYLWTCSGLMILTFCV